MQFAAERAAAVEVPPDLTQQSCAASVLLRTPLEENRLNGAIEQRAGQ